MEICNDFVKVNFDSSQICCCCKKQIKRKQSAKYLQCGHFIHSKCINKKILEKFGDSMDTVIIDKSKIWTDIDTNSGYNQMYFGTENTDGIIECDECNASYSILSPIYREFKIPKLIEKIILFESDGKILSYHICTTLDMIHLSNSKIQHKILKKFDIYNESTYMNKVYDTDLENPNQVIFMAGLLFDDDRKLSYEEVENISNKNLHKNKLLNIDKFIDWLINF